VEYENLRFLTIILGTMQHTTTVTVESHLMICQTLSFPLT